MDHRRWASPMAPSSTVPAALSRTSWPYAVTSPSHEPKRMAELTTPEASTRKNATPAIAEKRSSTVWDSRPSAPVSPGREGVRVGAMIVRAATPPTQRSTPSQCTTRAPTPA